MTETTQAHTARPGADPAGASQAALAELLSPICELALSQGVKLHALVELLKAGLVDAAVKLASDIGAEGANAPTGANNLSDSQLSVMTGVHRKDLRTLRAAGATRPYRRKNLAAEVFARWLSDPAYLTRKGLPRVLPRQAQAGDASSFEALVSGISRDVHPRSVLDELVRLKLVNWSAHYATEPPGNARADTVRVISKSFTPAADQQAQLAFLAANAADHLRAGRINLARGGKAFLEQAIYADELSAQSAEQFNRMTLTAWEQSFEQLMPLLRELFQDDKLSGRALTHRVRFGMFGFAAPLAEQKERSND